VEIAEDMARRILTTNLDARMEDPEQRAFRPGFLNHVLESRAALLSDAITIWRWVRHTVLKPGKPPEATRHGRSGAAIRFSPSECETPLR
jgi:hypothetical protein